MSRNFQNPVFLVLSAPSGAGKSTLVGLLRRDFPDFVYSVSCTTRAPRGTEQDGVAYHFVSEEEFSRRIAAGAFLEHALVHGHHYGTLFSEVSGPMEKGLSVLLDIDVAGAAQVRSALSSRPLSDPARRGFLDVFIDIPSIEELRRRLEKRGEDAPETIAARLAAAEGERARRGEYSAIVTNDDLQEAYAKLKALVLEKAGGEIEK